MSDWKIPKFNIRSDIFRTATCLYASAKYPAPDYQDYETCLSSDLPIQFVRKSNYKSKGLSSGSTSDRGLDQVLHNDKSPADKSFMQLGFNTTGFIWYSNVPSVNDLLPKPWSDHRTKSSVFRHFTTILLEGSEYQTKRLAFEWF